jgi:hypothetical protein
MTADIAARARRRTTIVLAAAAAAVVVLVAVAAGLVVLLGQRDVQPPTNDPGTPPPTVDAGPSSPALRPGPSSMPAPASPETAGRLTWATVAGARVPISPDAGPHDTGDGRARGFARSRLGAVLAAAHISLRLSPQAGPEVFGPTLREQVIGDDAAALGQQLDEDYEQARARLGLPYGQPAGRLYSTARGYRIEQDTPTAAEVRLLIEGPGTDGASVLVELRLHTQWVGADWALEAPPGGTWESVTTQVSDATEYVRFPDGG